jgi:hypothetical protein
MHVDKGVLAGGVVAGHQDRVGIPDKAEVRKMFISGGSRDGEVSLRVVGRYRRLRGRG